MDMVKVAKVHNAVLQFMGAVKNLEPEDAKEWIKNNTWDAGQLAVELYDIINDIS